MSEIPHDIGDNEIRVIGFNYKVENTTQKGLMRRKPPRKPSNRWKMFLVAVFVVAVLVIVLVCYMIFSGVRGNDELEMVTTEVIGEENDMAAAVADTVAGVAVEPMKGLGYVSISDTTINQVPLSIFTPVDLKPTLQIGPDVLQDSTARFVVQAADVRRDNGGIVGAYVYKGELLSKGQAKSGFCSIIRGKISIGVADSTPLLEQALETDGYFFRQYPLVVANQIVENKLKNSSLRKALAELNGQTVVIMSRKEMTMHDFSQSLVDLGVANAIYLVGGKSYGFAINKDGSRTEFGLKQNDFRENTNYIVWR